MVLLDLNGPAAAAVAQAIGPAALAVTGDVTRRPDIDRALAATVQHGGQVDIVVNNAGWSYRNQPLLDTTEDEFDRVFAINVKSIFHMVGAAVPLIAGCRRRDDQHRVHRRHPSAPRPRLVQTPPRAP